MGGDFGEEDERSISRIENTQYDVSMMGHGPGSGMQPSAMNTPMSVGMLTNGSSKLINFFNNSKVQRRKFLTKKLVNSKCSLFH